MATKEIVELWSNFFGSYAASLPCLSQSGEEQRVCSGLLGSLYYGVL